MDLFKYLISDRQWKRDHRIAHAKAMLKQAGTHTEREFWRDVIEANVGDSDG